MIIKSKSGINKNENGAMNSAMSVGDVLFKMSICIRQVQWEF